MTKRQNATIRVNARFNGELANRIASVAKREGRSISEVMRRAAQGYCDEADARQESVLERFERTGFVGCGSSAGKRRVDDKQELLEYLERKHGYR